MSCEVIKELNEPLIFSFLDQSIFRKELRLQILKLQRIVVVVHQFSKLKRIVSGKIHFLFPALGFLEAGLSFWKIAFEIGLNTKNVRFFVIFKGSGIVLILSQTSSF